MYDKIPEIPIHRVGDITISAITMGTIYLQTEYDGYINTFELKNALHVPLNCNNLLSLGKWEQEGHGISVCNGIIYLTDTNDYDLACGMKISKNLYQIKFSLILQTISEDNVICFLANLSAILWVKWH
jgi:hypothetical protein